jgi:predicted choloylglycine hydrolase
MNGRRAVVNVLVWVLLPGLVAAGEPFRFPEARHGKAELKYCNGLPVLVVEGTPEEIGEQIAALLAKPAARLLNYPKEVLTHFATPAGAAVMWPTFVKQGNQLLNNFPADYRAEFETAVKVGGIDRELLMVGNTAFDLKHLFAGLFGCSALLVESERSVTGKPLFGRNMDHWSMGYLHHYTLVTVCRPKGKHAFCSIGYAGMIGCISGINDAGLALAVLETTGAPSSEGPAYSLEGVPFALCYRRLLEECTTVEEALAALRKMKRTTTNNLAVCDRKGCAVFEITPTRVVERRSQNGIGVCTNHFCTAECKLATPKNTHTTLDRLATLAKAQAGDRKLGVEEIRLHLDAVNQGENTLQTMVFEPDTLTIHLAVLDGKTPSSSQKLKKLELGDLLRKPASERAASSP